MISLNEAHNMEAVLQNLEGFAREIFLVDSFSSDETVEIAIRHGVHVVQRRFRGFGDQWNYALRELPIRSAWTMKLDPDERLTDELKDSIRRLTAEGAAEGLVLTRRLWFMGRPMPVRQDILRVWKTGACRFSDVLVNEHPIVAGRLVKAQGTLEHHDSPHLQHWIDKQNAYTTAEALSAWRADALSEEPNLFGSSLARRMWLKRNFSHIPFRFIIMELYCLLVQGSWRAGRVGIIWAKLRADVFRWREYKLREMRLTGTGYPVPAGRTGPPHPKAIQADEAPARAPVKPRAAPRPGIDYHDSLANTWEARYTRGGLRRRALFVEQQVLARLDLKGDWLDAGCGTGHFTRLLAARGSSAYGIDGSQAMIQAARSTVFSAPDARAPRYDVQDIESLQRGKRRYDGVVCLSVLEYLENPDQGLESLAKVLRPGGRLILSVPNRASVLRGLQKLIRPLMDRTGRAAFDYLSTSRQQWSRAELRELVQTHGLECEAILDFDPLIPKVLRGVAPPSLLFVVARNPAVEMAAA